jgi:hypothetical protein
LATVNTREKDVRLWEMATGRERLRFPGINAVVFSPDGRSIAAVQERGAKVWDALTGEQLAFLYSQGGLIVSLAFSPDCEALATGCVDTTVLLWVVSPRGGVPGRQATPLSRKNLTEIWDDLAGEDAKRAYRAVARLANAAGAVEPFLEERLKDSNTVGAAQIKRLVDDLDSVKFADREKASDALSRLGRRVEPAQRKALGEHPSPEQARRLEKLLEKLPKAGTDLGVLRSQRAVEAMEHRATAQARQLLKSLAAADAEDVLSREARASLERLARRPIRP